MVFYFLCLGMIQARIDRMDELEQLIIKSAAVLGNSFSRDMLHSVVPSKGEQIPEEHFSRALHKLLSSGIFHCGIGFRLHGSKQLLSLLREKKDEECACPEDPYYSKGKNCRLLIFQSSSLQETAYDILLEDLRKNMHKKAAVYLERQAHKCEACGGGGFFPEHMVESLVTLESNSSEAVVSDKPKHLSHRRISLWKTAPNRIKRTITSVGEVGDETTFPQQSSPPSKQDSFALANITTAARPSTFWPVLFLFYFAFASLRQSVHPAVRLFIYPSVKVLKLCTLPYTGIIKMVITAVDPWHRFSNEAERVN